VSRKAIAPDGFERALTLADAVKAARASVGAKEAAIAVKEADLEKDRADLAKLRADLVKIERRFQELILSAAHADPNADHGHAPPSAAPDAKSKAKHGLPSDIPWDALPKKLQLAWILHDEGVLDYGAASMRIYGTNDNAGKARANSLLASLREEKVVGPSQGQRRYPLLIDRAELVRRSYAYTLGGAEAATP
jgi:hypothetical protein